MVFSHSQMFHFPGRIHGNWYTIAIHRSQYVFLQVFEAREAQRNSFARDYKVCLGWHLVGLIFTAAGFAGRSMDWSKIFPWNPSSLSPMLSGTSFGTLFQIAVLFGHAWWWWGQIGFWGRLDRNLWVRDDEHLNKNFMWHCGMVHLQEAPAVNAEFCDACMIPCCRESYIYLKFQLTTAHFDGTMGFACNLHFFLASPSALSSPVLSSSSPWSYIIHHTSYITHHTSYITHHTSYIAHHTSYITRHIIHHTSHHTSYITRHIIHHTSHHTSHSYIIHHHGFA